MCVSCVFSMLICFCCLSLKERERRHGVGCVVEVGDLGGIGRGEIMIRIYYIKIFSITKRYIGDGKLAQLVKYLSHKHVDLTLNSHNTWNKRPPL